MSEQIQPPPREVPGWGVDGDERRQPGRPMELGPEPRPGVHWERPERQTPRVEVLRRAGLRELTPVFGTAAPPRGLSGLMRRWAYGIPGHRVRHVMLLLLADRVDVLESRLLRRPARALGWGLGATGGVLLLKRLRA